MKSVLFGAAMAAVVLTSASAAQAQDWSAANRWAVGVTAGTDGLGADLKYALSPQLVLRARGAGLDFSHSETSDGVHYSGKIKFGTGGGFVDWHPWGGGFLISGGVVAGTRRIDLSGTPANNVTFNGDTYTPAQVGSVYGRAKMPSTAGFLGVGYDTTFVSRGAVGFNILAGAQFGGSPKVHLTATGLAASTPQFQTDLAREEDKIRHDLDFAKVYPAVSVGLTYRF